MRPLVFAPSIVCELFLVLVNSSFDKRNEQDKENKVVFNLEFYTSNYEVIHPVENKVVSRIANLCSGTSIDIVTLSL
jgi:hypothetical protein